MREHKMRDSATRKQHVKNKELDKDIPAKTKGVERQSSRKNLRPEEVIPDFEAGNIGLCAHISQNSETAKTFKNDKNGVSILQRYSSLKMDYKIPDIPRASITARQTIRFSTDKSTSKKRLSKDRRSNKSAKSINVYEKLLIPDEPVASFPRFSIKDSRIPHVKFEDDAKGVSFGFNRQVSVQLPSRRQVSVQLPSRRQVSVQLPSRPTDKSGLRRTRSDSAFKLGVK